MPKAMCHNRMDHVAVLGGLSDASRGLPRCLVLPHRWDTLALGLIVATPQYINHTIYHIIPEKSYRITAMDGKNANPTILNASDLPTRRQVQRKKVACPLTSGLVPAYAQDLFAGHKVEFSDSDESEDDSIVEPIDEQEIYGELARHI